MRIAIIADIHSNLHALEAVRKDIHKEGAEMVICAGDIVGYGAKPNESCKIVQGLASHAVFGNHEISALTGDTIWMNPHAARASKWTSGVLSASSREYLESLELGCRFSASGVSMAMFHGSVDSAIEYVYEEQLNEDLIENAVCDLLILAHTHVPYFKRFSKGSILNPGSVGQPRDGDPRASYSIYDCEKRTCDSRRIEYDIEGAYEAILSAGLPEFIAERLFFGR